MRENKKALFPWTQQDWIGLMIFKKFADQDWTWTEKFHSPLRLKCIPEMNMDSDWQIFIFAMDLDFINFAYPDFDWIWIW